MCTIIEIKDSQSALLSSLGLFKVNLDPQLCVGLLSLGTVILKSTYVLSDSSTRNVNNAVTVYCDLYTSLERSPQVIVNFDGDLYVAVDPF